MPKVILGVDSHKRLNAVVVLNMRGSVVARRSFANTTGGFRELQAFARRWRPRRWAIEGCNGVGKHLAQRLVAAGEEVVDVSTRRAALVRVFAEGNGCKKDDAHPIALVALHTPDLPVVGPDGCSVALRLLSQRRQELVNLRTPCVCRLHRDLVALLAGGAPRRLSAEGAKRLLATVKSRDEVGRLRRRLAADELAELAALDTRIAATDVEIAELVGRTDTSLPTLYGVGPVVTAMVLGEVGNIARFRTRHHFASYNGSAPDDKGSAGNPAYAVNLKGNRRLNHALNIVAVTQIAHECAGRWYYQRKLAEARRMRKPYGHSSAESPTPCLVADARRQVGPGGQVGTTPETSVTGPTPTAGSLVRQQPGPRRKARPFAASA